tara:strand:+ start:209 stop:664 length:456 start_codon:yes stop_codon:yes gene_type:complete
MDIGKNMILINAADIGSMQRSFKMIPANNDCPYVECIYSMKDGFLAVITKNMKQSYHMVPKLDDNGDPIPMKGKVRPNKKDYKEERRLVDTFSEFYLMTPEEIDGFIKLYAINAKEFDYDQFINPPVPEDNEKLFVPEKPTLVKSMAEAKK